MRPASPFSSLERLARATRLLLASLVLGLASSSLSIVGRSAQPSPSENVVIAVAGDVLPESSWETAQSAEHLFDGVREEFGRADLVFLNLEEPITSAGSVTPYKNPVAVKAGRDYVLRARNPALFRIIKDAGVGLVGLANNHMLDYTGAGLGDTLSGFQETGLRVVGAGLKPEAERAYVFERKGVRVALLAFSDVVPTHYEATDERLGIASSKDEADLVNAIRRARRKADYVVLMMHWGGQGRHRITPRQRQLGRAAARAGCAAVVGMHPHVLQGIELLGHVPVFYSIGNFAFPSKSEEARECVLVRLEFGPRGIAEVNLIPVEISPSGAPQVAEGGRGSQILDHLDGFCRMFNARVQGRKLVGGPVRERLIYDSSVRRTRRSAGRGERG